MAIEQPRWVDSHCHLFASDDDPAVLLERADQAGIDWLMCPGIDLETSLQAHRLSVADRDRVASVGRTVRDFELRLRTPVQGGQCRIVAHAN